MFARYTVLFIGYSHNDTVMRLIARGIGGARRRRYALTHEVDRDVWKTYGVVPIRYEVVGDSHAALADSLNGWADLTSMGLNDHRQRIAQLVGAPPSLVPEEDSYLEDVLSDVDRVRFFAELADHPGWLSWAAGRSRFQAMFRADASHDPCTVVLADWFVERFVMKETRTEEALAVLYDGGGLPAPVLCAALGRHLHRRSGLRPPWLGPWLAVLIQHAGDEDTHWLEYALLKCGSPADRVVALLLFDSLTQPRLRQRARASGGKPSFEITLRGSVDHLDEAWTEFFRPILAEVAAAILAIADRQLRRISELLTVSGAARPGWDPVSFSRYKIERDAGDEIRQSVDALIDTARDCVEALLAAGGPSGPGYLDTWAASDLPILRRLALHGWTYRTDIDATAKLAWLRTTGWLFEHQLRPEVYHLIANALPNALAAEADALVADTQTLPVTGRDDEHVAYLRFNALTWLVRSAPALTSARAALEELQAAYPRFQAREQPDLLRSRIEVTTLPEQPPMTVDELHERITANPAAAVAELRRYEHVQLPFDGPDWNDALRVLTAAIHDHPSDGFAVLAVAEPPIDIVTAMIDGWSAAPLNRTTAVAVVQRILDLELEAVADSVARLLVGGLVDAANATKWHLLPEARKLAELLWDALGPVDPPDGGRDWFTLAINRPAGQLAQFWVRAVSADWTAAGDAWEGLPSELRRPLEAMLGGPNGPTWLAQPVLTGQLAFLFGADRPWCTQFLLPLMAWAGDADKDRPVRTWTGYLTTGRITDDLFEAGLRNAYLDAIEQADRLPDDLRRALPAHLAAIAVYGSTDPLTWVEEFTARAEEEQRIRWMTEVADTLGNLAPDIVEQQWQRWMQRYWQRRHNSVPTALTFGEASALATWIPWLTDSLAVGVDLATRHRAGLTEHHTLDDWTDERLAQAPALFARLLAHLLTGTTPPIWDDVARVALAVKDDAEPAAFSVIRDQALRLGFSSAANW
ncbi:hypothetical protein DKT69_25675 [Micromonospora sicca]|uniref:Uncharacterized protein n=1 Tax=Micromonospora sicca TaxID=2202420 RepID=A0A317DGE0_9ACTN|nr:DUF4020 domain-containing protein [Micromonospora sp. 4G51]PWR11823.1 hypothetical protein DKT69_25675 [Micromonospora sp. 4G51]